MRESVFCEVRYEPLSRLQDLSQIPTTFEVKSVFDVDRDALGAIRLRERFLQCPYWKDYDSISDNRPTDWAGQFEMSNWCLLSAHNKMAWIGGALIAWKTPELEMLENRSDLAVLWDLRIHPRVRRRGIASKVFAAAEAWSRLRGCRELKVETQNINVPACRFYASQGCQLRMVRDDVYPECPDEIQLLWYKDLTVH